ncbi:MAG: kinE 2, partial [Sporomusa sp.]|nr:kinE 2 [Sporomusa sp.]
DAVDASTRQLTIRTWHDDDRVYLEVSDNGPGIDDKIKDRIFEPFFSTKSGDSMGLGLSIVHSIVIASNGLISVGNSSFGGAAIKVSFPVYCGT